jgi:hypothetical protein
MSAAFAAGALSLLGFGGEAAAQPTIALAQDGRSGDRRPEQGINLDDCTDVETWDFSYNCIGCQNVAVWIGDNCDMADNRAGASPTCHELVSFSAAPSLAQALTIKAGRFADPFDETEAACEPTDTTTSVFVLDLGDTSDDATAFGVYDVLVDTRRPPAPIDIEATAGEGNVTVSWTADASDVQDRDAFQVLCFPNPPDPGGAGGGGSDAGADAGVGDCGLGGFVEGDEPNDEWADLYFCGDRQAETARSLRIEGLSNGGAYEFAVLAYDDFQNPSLVSGVTCESPRPVEDFYESYRGAGGQAGGGFCSAVPAGGRAVPLAPALSLLALGLRRRRA